MLRTAGTPVAAALRREGGASQNTQTRTTDSTVFTYHAEERED